MVGFGAPAATAAMVSSSQGGQDSPMQQLQQNNNTTGQNNTMVVGDPTIDSFTLNNNAAVLNQGVVSERREGCGKAHH